MIPKKGNGNSSSRHLIPERRREVPVRDPPHRRALFCASLLSLGALCAGMVLLRTEPDGRCFLLSQAAQMVRSTSEFLRLSLFFSFPLVLVLLGLIPLGPAFLAALDILFGAAFCLGFSALLNSDGSPLTALLFIPAAISSVYLSASVLHLSGLLFRQVSSGGRFRPDLRPLVLRIAIFSILFELIMFFFWLLF